MEPSGTNDIKVYTNIGLTILYVDLGSHSSQPYAWTMPNAPAGTNYYITYGSGVPPVVIAVVSVTVLPEVAVFGSIAVVGAGLAAFGTIRLVKMKRKN